MFDRILLPTLLEDLAHEPAVGLLGPRQVGKTTLALAAGEAWSQAHGQAGQSREPGRSGQAGRSGHGDPLYLDLESDRDRDRLADPQTYLEQQLHRLVIIDEVHRAPGLFPVLRGLIDRARRQGRRHGLYLLLGSASLDVLKQSGESLAGRIVYRELGPLHPLETPTLPLDSLWLRGGLPDSLLAASDRRSLLWRQSFIRTYLERDVPQFGPRIAPDVLRRFWTMLAHHQGGLLNAAQLGRNLGVDVKTAQSYLHLLQDLLLVRLLPPWHANLGKRLVKSPKVYVRDAGLVHALLGIESLHDLLGHPVVGASWEGFAIEALLAAAPEGLMASFYRSAAGAEVDLVLHDPSGRCWAIEVKRSHAPKVERGFHSACLDLQPVRRVVVASGAERWVMTGGIEVMPLTALCQELRNLSTPSLASGPPAASGS